MNFYVSLLAFAATVAQANPVPAAAVTTCTHVVPRLPHLTWGPTRTVWTTTTTSTHTIDCGPCATYAIYEIPLGVPPVVFFNETVTATEASVTTQLACGHPAPTTPTPEASPQYTLTTA